MPALHVDPAAGRPTYVKRFPWTTAVVEWRQIYLWMPNIVWCRCSTACEADHSSIVPGMRRRQEAVGRGWRTGHGRHDLEVEESAVSKT